MAVTMNHVKNFKDELYIGPRIPQGLTAAIEGLTKEIIRHSPEDIYMFAANHFEKLLEIRNQCDESNATKSRVIGNKLKRTKDTEKQTKKKLCDCKKRSRSQDAVLKSSGWSLNETAKVLKRHRSIFGDDGKKISLDEIYDLANVKRLDKLTAKQPKDHVAKTKAPKKAEETTTKGEPNEENSEPKVSGDKRKLNPKRRTGSREVHQDEVTKMHNSKVESLESSRKVSNTHEINYSSQTNKLSIQESEGSSYVQKIYQSIRETTSTVEQKIQESTARAPRSEAKVAGGPTGSAEPGIASKFSKSTNCLAAPSKLKADAFENKLKETQNLLETISTNFSQTMRRSMSAKDLRRTSQSVEFSESSVESHVTKLRQISLPTVRPFSASKNDLFRKLSLNETLDDCFTLPLISRKSNKSAKQTENDIVLPKLSPANNGLVNARCASEDVQRAAENQDQNYTIIRDIDKQVINILENKTDNVRTYSTECKQLVNITEKITELKPTSNMDGKEASEENVQPEVASNVEEGDELSRERIEDGRVIFDEASRKVESSLKESENTKAESNELKKTETKESVTRIENENKTLKSSLSFESKEIILKTINESVDTLINNNDKDSQSLNYEKKISKPNKNLNDEPKMPTDKEQQINGTLINPESNEPDKRIDFKKCRYPSFDCKNGINNELLRSKLEELVRAEKSILHDISGINSETEVEESSDLETKGAKDSYGIVGGSSEDRRGSVCSGKSEIVVNGNNKEVAEDEIYSYILTEGSPCDIPDTVTTVVFPDSLPSTSDDIKITIDEINNDILTTVFGESIQYEETNSSSIDHAKALKNLHDLSIVRQDLHRIKEEDEEEENDTSVNEDSTIVLEKMLQKEELKGNRNSANEKECDMSLQEFLLHCTLNESTEETSMNDVTDDAAMPYVPELNLQLLEDDTESLSKTDCQKSDDNRSIDDIENSTLLSQRTSTSTHKLEDMTQESLSGNRESITQGMSSLQINTIQNDSSQSNTSKSTTSENLLQSVLIIQKCYRLYKSKKQKSTSDVESLIKQIDEKCVEVRKDSEAKETDTFLLDQSPLQTTIKNKSAEITAPIEAVQQGKENLTQCLSTDDVVLAVIKIQKYYRKYKFGKECETKTAQAQSTSETSSILTKPSSSKTREECGKKKSASSNYLHEMIRAALTIQKYYRKYISRKRNKIASVQKEVLIKNAQNETIRNKSFMASIEKHPESKDCASSDERGRIKDLKEESPSANIREEGPDRKELTSNGIQLKTQESMEINSSRREDVISTLVEKEESLTQAISFVNEDIRETSKIVTFNQMVLSATKIQKYYKRYKSRKLHRCGIEDIKKRPLSSSFLQHTGEFHDCIPLSTIDCLPKLSKQTDKEAQTLSESSGSGDQRRARREWNRNPSLPSNVLRNTSFLKDLDGKRSNSEDSLNHAQCADRFPGVMIYSDSLKNNFAQSSTKQPVDNEVQQFMNFVLFSGQDPMLQKSYINFMSMRQAQKANESKNLDTDIDEQLEFVEPKDSGVIIEEISNDED